jgi:hypothetical protein
MNHRFKAGTFGALLVAVALLAVCFGSMTVNAQILYGSITGTVSDRTGAVIPGGTVTITNQGTNAVRSTTINGQGTYLLLDVLPGMYTVSVPAKGNFSGSSVKDIQIEVNRQARVDIMLQPAAVSTQITVTEAPPLLQTETAEVNNEINQTQLSQMPLTSSVGRSFQALYTIIPGAANVKEQNSTASNPSRAMSVNVNGMNMNGNTTRIDGAVNYYGWLTYLIAYVPPPDSIENVSVTTNDFSAEQGQAGGASIKITTKSGTHDFHGSVWEYYQDAAMNARPYTTTTGVLPKNIFDEFGGNVGGPIYLPRILTSKKKLFFFDNWERTTRRQLISGLQTVPDTLMIGGNLSEAASVTTLYDPLPQVAGWQSLINTTLCPTIAYTNGYLNYACRPSFTAEYGETGTNVNTIPASRLSSAASTMIANLSTIAASIGTPSTALINAKMANDYLGEATYAYNRTSNDTKITYIPNENTQVFGKYSIEPFQVNDPQELGAAGGGTFDGGQPGAGHGKIQNVGMGISHVISASLVADADFGYTRQWSGAQSKIDLADGNYGLNVLKIPGTNLSSNPSDSDYWGQPLFAFNSGFSSIGNSNTANPFSFRDNQFTGDVNLSWVKGRHQTKYGFTYYHFDLNHFQPTSGGGVSNVRGGFQFQGGMTCGVTPTATTASCGVTAYNSLADFLLGLPNNGGGNAIQKAQQTFDPNSLRWTELGAYAQDQWTITPKLTITYGVRYEKYPAAYRDHTGIYVVQFNRPNTSNVEVGGVMGNPKDAGVDTGPGMFAPRVGIAYRLTNKTVIRAGGGITIDPDSMRYLRDSFPMDLAPNYAGTGTGTIAVDTANTTNYATGQPMPITDCSSATPVACYGIPIPTPPNYSSGFAGLPVTGSTNSVWSNFRRGYIESWNIFVQRDLGKQFVANIGYVGDHFVRQQAGVSPYNAAPLPSASTPCLPNGHWNTSMTGLTGTCSYTVNETINWLNCTNNGWASCAATSGLWNTGGITMNGPIFSANYNAMQAQLTRNAGKNFSLGVVYTYGHAFDYEDNGAGTGAGGTTFNYPAYYKLNRASSGFDVKHNLQVWTVYSLPFGHGHQWANHGIADEIIGGFQLNGQYSYLGGQPFSVAANSNLIGNVTPGWGTTYAQLIAPYKKLGGHERIPGDTGVSGGKSWFDPTSFANPTEPAGVTPVLPNTHRNEFRGPASSIFNMSAFKGFHVYRETEFQIRFEAFNVLNHALLYNNPNVTVGGGTFGYITSFGPAYSPTQGARSLQFGGRFNF